MPALIDYRLCDSSVHCAAVRACPSQAMVFDHKEGKVRVDEARCNTCRGYCANACPMGAVGYAPTTEALAKVKAEITGGPSAEDLFEQKYGVRPVDQRAAATNLSHADEQTFEAEVLNSPIPVAVDFWAEWCAPCKILAPTFKAVAEEFVGRMKFAKVDTENSQSLAARYRVFSIPTVAFFVDGRMVDTSMGAVPKAVLKGKAEKVLATVGARR